uniref:Putative conserved plasma membrane protein n=1 Tax=Culex tarsalis TaxID=7177 RepID=A0A1Q3FSJ2_CULTA
MHCAECNYYTWSYFIAFGEIFFSFEAASALLACTSELDRHVGCYDVEPIFVLLFFYNFLSLMLILGVAKRMEKLLQIYQTCTLTLKASAVVRRAILSATEYDESNLERTVAEMKLIIMFTLIFTLEALVVAGAVRKMRREQQEPQYYIDIV